MHSWTCTSTSVVPCLGQVEAGIQLERRPQVELQPPLVLEMSELGQGGRFSGSVKRSHSGHPDPGASGAPCSNTCRAADNSHIWVRVMERAALRASSL